MVQVHNPISIVNSLNNATRSQKYPFSRSWGRLHDVIMCQKPKQFKRAFHVCLPLLFARNRFVYMNEPQNEEHKNKYK